MLEDRPNPRRYGVLAAGLVPLIAGLVAIVVLAGEGVVPVEVAAYFVGMGVLLAVLGTWWWVEAYKDQLVDETAPRTVQYVYMQPPAPPKPRTIYSTVYTARSHPLEDGRSLQMWSRLRSEDTGDLTRFR